MATFVRFGRYLIRQGTGLVTGCSCCGPCWMYARPCSFPVPCPDVVNPDDIFIECGAKCQGGLGDNGPPIVPGSIVYYNGRCWEVIARIPFQDIPDGSLLLDKDTRFLCPALGCIDPACLEDAWVVGVPCDPAAHVGEPPPAVRACELNRCVVIGGCWVMDPNNTVARLPVDAVPIFGLDTTGLPESCCQCLSQCGERLSPPVCGEVYGPCCCDDGDTFEITRFSGSGNTLLRLTFTPGNSPAGQERQEDTITWSYQLSGLDPFGNPVATLTSTTRRVTTWPPADGREPFIDEFTEVGQITVPSLPPDPCPPRPIAGSDVTSLLVTGNFPIGGAAMPPCPPGGPISNAALNITGSIGISHQASCRQASVAVSATASGGFTDATSGNTVFRSASATGAWVYTREQNPNTLCRDGCGSGSGGVGGTGSVIIKPDRIRRDFGSGLGEFL